ncbi:hypothetical protein [Chengkuizengella sediminis]|nr:hypothetical protein [Chengkuizengella sediminis]NDI35723.1 hypothetical protein [Chengkuizengella sediminis]
MNQVLALQQLEIKGKSEIIIPTLHETLTHTDIIRGKNVKVLRKEN